MRLSKRDKFEYTDKVVEICHLAGGFGVIVRGILPRGDYDQIVWSWSGGDGALHASGVYGRFCPDAGFFRNRFRAGRHWVYLDEVQRA